MSLESRITRSTWIAGAALVFGLSLLARGSLVRAQVEQAASPTSSPLASDVTASPTPPGTATDSATTTPEATADPGIGQKSPLADKIAALRTQYRGEVEAYRKAEQEYVVAKGQWESVKTLVALETAVQKTKSVLLARTRVLQVYLELVQTILLDTQGVNIAQREAVSNELTARLVDLKTHLAAVEASTDRDAMNARSDEFALLSPQIVSAAHKGMALVAVGKLQNVSDVARLLHTDILEQQAQATVSALQQSERDRANKEIVRSQDQVTVKMQDVNQTLQDSQEKIVSESLYVRTQQELGPVYAALSQILSFLKESLRY